MNRYQRLGLLTVLLIVGLFLAYAWTGWMDASGGLAIFVVLVAVVALSSVAMALSWHRSESAA